MKAQLTAEVESVIVNNGEIFIKIRCGYGSKLIRYCTVEDFSDKIKATSLIEITQQPLCCNHKSCKGSYHCKKRVK